MSNNNNNTARDQDDVARQNYALNGKIMLCSVIILVAAVFVIFGIHSYARCLRRRRSRRRNHHHPAAGAPPQQGLDPAVLKSLPTFTFSSSASASASASAAALLECAVCLSEFQNDEPGRVLPKCNHTFHADCIDMWFHYHSNCPLCRAPVRPAIPEISIVVVTEPAPEPASSSSGPASSSAEPGSGPPELKPPGNRVLTLKRIWSV